MKLFLTTLIFTCFLLISHAHAQSMTLTTYYPAPSGNYDHLSTKYLTLNALAAGETADCLRRYKVSADRSL